LKSIFVRPEESKPVETTQQQEPSAFDKTIDPADTTGVAKRNAIQQRKTQINPK
jgi:hypothetical protein